MKTNLFLALALFVPATAFSTNTTTVTKPVPQTQTQAQTQAQTQTQTQAQTLDTNAQASSTVQDSSQNLATNIINLSVPQEQTIKNTPGIFSGSLTSSLDTCLGSANGGISTAGFGLTLGSTTVDKNCVMRKNADLLYRMGLQKAALILVCNQDETIKAAVEKSGVKCE